MKINKKLIKELVDNLEEFKLSELEYSEKDIKIKVSRQSKMSQNISPEITIERNNQKAEAVSGTEIKSPIIGTAYLAPEPGAKKFVETGKKIKKGDTCLLYTSDLPTICSV